MNHSVCAYGVIVCLLLEVGLALAAGNDAFFWLSVGFVMSLVYVDVVLKHE